MHMCIYLILSVFCTHRHDETRGVGGMTTVAWAADGRPRPGFLRRCWESGGDPGSRCFRLFHYLRTTHEMKNLRVKRKRIYSAWTRGADDYDGGDVCVYTAVAARGTERAGEGELTGRYGTGRESGLRRARLPHRFLDPHFHLLPKRHVSPPQTRASHIMLIEFTLFATTIVPIPRRIHTHTHTARAYRP